MTNEPTTYVIVALVILSLGTTLGWLLARGKAILLTEQVAQLQHQTQTAILKARAANELAVREKRRADEQFKVIEQATEETKAVWTLYRRQSIGAGNAQAWLFRELESLAKAFYAKAERYNFEPYHVPKQLRRVISTYREEHLIEENATKAKDALVAENVAAIQGVDQAELVEEAIRG
jgi:hypothetical protein